MGVMTRRKAIGAMAMGLFAPAVLRGRYQLFAQSNAQYRARRQAPRIISRRRSAQSIPVPGLLGKAAQDRPVAVASWHIHRRRRQAIPAVRHHRVCTRLGRAQLRRRPVVLRPMERLSRGV